MERRCYADTVGHLDDLVEWFPLPLPEFEKEMLPKTLLPDSKFTVVCAEISASVGECRRNCGGVRPPISSLEFSLGLPILLFNLRSGRSSDDSRWVGAAFIASKFVGGRCIL